MTTNALSEQERSDTTDGCTDNDQEVLAYDGDDEPITREQYESWENSDCTFCSDSEFDGYVVMNDHDDVLCYDCFESFERLVETAYDPSEENDETDDSEAADEWWPNPTVVHKPTGVSRTFDDLDELELTLRLLPKDARDQFEFTKEYYTVEDAMESLNTRLLSEYDGYDWLEDISQDPAMAVARFADGEYSEQVSPVDPESIERVYGDLPITEVLSVFCECGLGRPVPLTSFGRNLPDVDTEDVRSVLDVLEYPDVLRVFASEFGHDQAVMYNDIYSKQILDHFLEDTSDVAELPY